MGFFGIYVFFIYLNLFLKCVWFSEVERFREGKLKWVICICVFFEVYYKNSYFGNIVNSFIYLFSLIYLGIKFFGFFKYRVVLEVRLFMICVFGMLVILI